MKNSLKRNKIQKKKSRLRNRTKNMKSSSMMNTNKKKGNSKDPRQAAIQEEDRNNKLKRTKKYWSINKSYR